MLRAETVSPVTADPLVSADVATPCDLTMTKWLRALIPRSRRRAEQSGFVLDIPLVIPAIGDFWMPQRLKQVGHQA